MKKMRMNKTVKIVFALTVSCMATALELASVVISIPAQIADWSAKKLVNCANKLMRSDTSETVTRIDNGDNIINAIKDIDAE